MEMPRGQAASGMQHQLRDGCANSSFTICTSYRQMGHFTVPGMLFQWSSCHLEVVQDLLFQDVLSGNPKSLPSPAARAHCAGDAMGDWSSVMGWLGLVLGTETGIGDSQNLWQEQGRAMTLSGVVIPGETLKSQEVAPCDGGSVTLCSPELGDALTSLRVLRSPEGHQEVTWRLGTGLYVLMPVLLLSSFSEHPASPGGGQCPSWLGWDPHEPSSEDPQVWPPQGSQIPAGSSLAAFTWAGGAESRATPRAAALLGNKSPFMPE